MKTQFEYTHIIRYRYVDEMQPKFHYFSSDSFSLSPSELDAIKGDLNIEEEDEIEVLGYVGNDFNSDECLSDRLIYALNDQSNSASFGNDFAEIHCAYIRQIYSEALGEQKEYQRHIASSLVAHLKAKGINRELVQYILSNVGLSLREKGGVLTQLRLIAYPSTEDIILKKLAIPSDIPTLRHCLKRMDEFFSFNTEPSQLKIATVFYVFMENSELLRSEVQGKFETVNRLLSEYYGIPKPTQRRGDVLNYLEKNYSSPKGYKKKPMLVFQEQEHIKFWNSLR